MEERRSEQRFLCADLLTVEIRKRGKPVAEAMANLEDISRSGVCLDLEMAVEAGMHIDIFCGRCRLKGRVRHCRFTGIGYLVGIQLAKESLWDRERYRPKHLLDTPTRGIDSPSGP